MVHQGIIGWDNMSKNRWTWHTQLGLFAQYCNIWGRLNTFQSHYYSNGILTAFQEFLQPTSHAET